MFHDILVPLDLEDPKIWSRALDVAVTLARTFDAKLHLLTVLPEFGLPSVAQYFPPDYEEKRKREAMMGLETVAKTRLPEGVRFDLIVGEGTVWREILRVGEERRCDLIVMGSHVPGLRDYVLGANATRVAQRAKSSVMIVRSERAV